MSLRKKTILIADDEREIIRIINAELKDYYDDIQILNAGNGKMALRVAEEELPDIIIMDWEMPEMDGIEATRAIRKSERTQNIPVIIATGRMTQSEDLRIALEAGAVDFVRKPIEFIELIARINTALRIKEQNLAIQQLLKSEIELKSRKLTTTSMLIVEQNNLLSSFFDELDAIERKAYTVCNKLTPEIKDLKRRIQNYFDVDKSWDTFKFHFEEVHPKFFDTIQQQGSDISHKDLKLCAYLKLGMDNKEIANLLNITASSARVTLSRLKKKLNISEEDNLRDIIAAI
ncbi:response regulator [Marinigracilibium pacificum]|uniref:Response regulator transcription factor n=1 Tax=Marinigracilibium pacificum TaxID=2729599 RepID=A0A848J2I5_9BACT|nr:response regulator [Marinigracilibium pacificum]NMM49538.1 response regulator transcription factor [Marinigracilibium pacificum]